MAIMSSFKVFAVFFVAIVVNENLFCNAKPGLYLTQSKYHKTNCECDPDKDYSGETHRTIVKRSLPIYGHHQMSQATYPMGISGLQPVTTYPGNYQPVANTIQQPMAYQHQPIQQGYYAQPTISGHLQPATTISRYPATSYVQPDLNQQVEYIQPQTTQQFQYKQPSTSGIVKPIKSSEKPIYKTQNTPQVTQSKTNYIPKAQMITSNSEPVKYTIPTAPISQQSPSQSYYSVPTTSYTTYPQGHVLPKTSYSQSYSVPELSYPQGYQIPQTSYPQSYPVPETSYPQGYPVPETSYPQGYPVPETSYPQGYPVPETSYPQGYPVPETSYPQGYGIAETYNPQGYQNQRPYYQITYPQQQAQSQSHTSYPIEGSYPVGQLTQEVFNPQYVDGKKYIQTSPEYLQQRFSKTYPYGDPNVRIFTGKNIIFPMQKKVNTPSGEIDVELIDIMPYKPGTEPAKTIPRVDSIETIIENRKKSFGEEVDLEPTDNNSIEKTTRASFFG